MTPPPVSKRGAEAGMTLVEVLVGLVLFALIGMAVYAYSAIRRSGLAHPNKLALHWTVGSAVFTLFGAGLLGLAHTFPDINKWTHGTLITAMHGHAAFYGAYAMIVLAMIAYALP